ncbi:MAG TPA: RNA-binding protein [Acholeplasmataceae bacterium]|nr:MAG: RNA-binding protein [Tenericutes bacterium GWD2_38_27]OHE35129.1 MAG: RNA-binding protein [Tenericutes bacterium GWE2_38_8]OHE41242.1 MAG: RNA-binding protein [Tenericutes bacterium GWF2_38_8]HBG32729.1 RNA-binding protein [Acholeplasmataceae bacterium]HBY65502.1 RNA-binding protein [Acholeplasmataceae bacterium]
MRLDKYLKVARIIKRRTVAKEAAEKEKVEINGKLAKPSSAVKENDVLTLHLGQKIIKVKVTSIEMKRDQLMYELLEEEKQP